MSDFSIEVTLETLVCRVTESIHSSDKFALAGAVFTDTDSAGIILPMMRINNGETRPLHTLVFSGASNAPKVGLSLQAWDLDENDSWVENEEDIKKIAAAVSLAVKQIPGYGTTAGAVLDVVRTTVPPIVDQFIEWDKNDQLLDHNAWHDLPTQGAYVTAETQIPINFSNFGSVLGYSDFDYTLELSARCTWTPQLLPPGPPPTIPESTLAMQDFRHRADIAAQEGFVGAYPNFYVAQYGLNHVGGTVFLRANAAEWRDVSLSDLRNPSLEDFGARMRATQDYALQQGFVGGFPNFYHAVTYFSPQGWPMVHPRTVCGTVLIRPSDAVWRDVPLAELGNPPLDNIGARFRASQEYASRNGFIGGFPNFYHADYGGGIVCGTILLQPSAGEWRDILLFRDPT